jgi:hypothetical protein
VLVQIQNVISHSHTLIVELRRGQLGVKRVWPDLDRVDGRRKADGGCYAARIGELGVLANPAVKVVCPELGLGLLVL